MRFKWINISTYHLSVFLFLTGSFYYSQAKEQMFKLWYFIKKNHTQTCSQLQNHNIRSRSSRRKHVLSTSVRLRPAASGFNMDLVWTRVCEVRGKIYYELWNINIDHSVRSLTSSRFYEIRAITWCHRLNNLEATASVSCLAN